MMVAAMDQYRTLWPKDVGGAPPMLFSFFNNFYGMGGQTLGETMGFKVLARIGAGVNPEQMHAERVDGYNPLAVCDAIERKKKVLLEGRGPVLLDIVTYRYSGHSPSDASSYRTKEEVALWQEVDCISSFGKDLVAAKVAAEEDLQAIQHAAQERMRRITELAVSPQVSPRVKVGGMGPGSDAIGDMMFSNGNVEKLDDRQPEMLLPPAQNPRILANARKSRSGNRPGRETASQEPGHRPARCDLRSHAASLLHRPHHGGLRGGEPGLGRRVCRVPRAHRGAPLPPPVQHVDLRGRDRRRRRRLRAFGRQGGSRAHVLRLPGQGR